MHERLDPIGNSLSGRATLGDGRVRGVSLGQVPGPGRSAAAPDAIEAPLTATAEALEPIRKRVADK